MKILATNLSMMLIPSLVLNYTAVTGAVHSESVPLPPATEPTAPLAAATQPASAFDSITITIAGTPYTVLYGQSAPPGSGVQLYWAQNSDASIIVITEFVPGGGKQ